jgi:hypothetical protein
MTAEQPESRPSQPARTASGLRLRAEDGEDLAVISACLQDALVAVRDLAYDQDTRCFLLVANRLRWEYCPGGIAAPGLERTLCGVEFGDVDRISYRGFRRTEEDRILSLLAMRTAPPAAGAAAIRIDLEFAAGASIRIAVASLSCRARDFGEPWPARWLPDHALEDMP